MTDADLLDVAHACSDALARSIFHRLAKQKRNASRDHERMRQRERYAQAEDEPRGELHPAHGPAIPAVFCCTGAIGTACTDLVWVGRDTSGVLWRLNGKCSRSMWPTVSARRVLS